MINEQQFLGDKIKKLRLNLGETMEQFGKRFNTSKGTINNWEKGRNNPNKENLFLLAKLADTSVSDFLLGVSDEEKQDLYKDYLSNISDIQKKDFVKEYLSYDYLEKYSKNLSDNFLHVKNQMEIAEEEYLFKKRMENETTIEFLNNINSKIHSNTFEGLSELANAILNYSLTERVKTDEEKEVFRLLLKKIPLHLNNLQRLHNIIIEHVSED